MSSGLRAAGAARVKLTPPPQTRRAAPASVALTATAAPWLESRRRGAEVAPNVRRTERARRRTPAAAALLFDSMFDMFLGQKSTRRRGWYSLLARAEADGTEREKEPHMCMWRGWRASPHTTPPPQSTQNLARRTSHPHANTPHLPSPRMEHAHTQWHVSRVRVSCRTPQRRAHGPTVGRACGLRSSHATAVSVWPHPPPPIERP